MNAIVVNNMQSKIAPLHESIALRLGYLLSDYVTSAGTSWGLIDAASIYKTFNFEMRLRTVESQDLRLEGSSGMDYKSFLQSYKNLLKIKSKSKDDMVRIKYIENKVNLTFNTLTEGMLESAKALGLIQLEPLLREDNFLCYGNEINDSEKENDFMTPLSKIFQNIPVENKYQPENKPVNPIFFLTLDYFADEFFAKAKEMEKEYPLNFIQHCCTFPNVNLFSATELQVLKKRFTDAGILWQNKMNEWISKVYESNQSMQEFFNIEVLPLAAAINNEVAENTLMQHISNLQNHEIKVELWVGSISISTLWEFYRHHGVIQDDTWEKLMKAKKENPALSGSWPVMLFNSKQVNLATVTQEGEAGEVKAVKKHLSID